jgi:hypothetical protein
VFRAALTFLAFGLGFGAACYSERLPPPAYRYPCDADGDCAEGESCVSGLCEVRCSQATFEDDCPAAGSYLACINGLCANGCESESPACPDSTECIDLSALGVDVSGGGSNALGGGGSTAAIGVCGRLCEPNDGTCPDGEVCVLGLCAESCDPADPDACSGGLVCLAEIGVCGPAGLDDGGDSAGGSGTATDGSDSAATDSAGSDSGTGGA